MIVTGKDIYCTYAVCSDISPVYLQFTEDENEISYSDREYDLDETADVSSFPWSERLGDSQLSPVPSSSRSASLAVPFRAERSGRDTPASVDSIPLEWDHDYDLSRGLESATRSSEQGDECKDGAYLQGSVSALSGQYVLLSQHLVNSIALITRLHYNCVEFCLKYET